MKHLSLLVLLTICIPFLGDAGYLPDCPDELHNTGACAQYFENKLLKNHRNLFQRTDRSLSINLTNGKKKVYTDVDSDSGTYYSVIKYFLDVGYALIHVGYLEGHSYFLLNTSNGAEWKVEGYALLSPKKKRFLIYEKDLDAEYSPNVLRIYRINPQGLDLEFDALPEHWGPSQVRWIDEQEVVFSKDSRNPTDPNYSPETHESRGQRMLKYRGGVWTLN